MVKDNLAGGATNNPAVIRSWSVECNVGLALAKSKVIAVDVDRKPGKNGEQTFDDLEFRHGDVEHDAASGRSRRRVARRRDAVGGASASDRR